MKTIPIEKTGLEAAIDRAEGARRQAEWEELVRLAESVFPKEWSVRVEPFSDGVHVSVKYVVARGHDPFTALRNAIEWYQKQSGSRIIIPR
jgi:hypothetical protein